MLEELVLVDGVLREVLAPRCHGALVCRKDGETTLVVALPLSVGYKAR
jgi:hypothetical protein